MLTGIHASNVLPLLCSKLPFNVYAAAKMCRLLEELCRNRVSVPLVDLREILLARIRNPISVQACL